MQIVIDIPEKEYKRWQDEGEMDALIVRNSLVNGTPLPKGHGRLIDADELTENTLCKTFGLRSVDIENATTIIEADRGDEE